MSQAAPSLPLRIALPKGRMSEEALSFLYQQKVTSVESFDKNRKLIQVDEANQIEFLLIRSKDVGTYVEHGAADMGVIGFDLLSEHDFKVYDTLALPFGHCTLSIAYPGNMADYKKRRNLKVASKYPHLTSHYFFEQGFNIQIIELYGSIEIAPLTGIADVIVDLVSTGQTLKANNLVKGENILESSAHLVVNPSAYVFKRKRINTIIDKLNKGSSV